MSELTEDEIKQACAWSDFRADYGVSRDPEVLRLEHRAFKAGWDAAKNPAEAERGALR